MRAPEEIQADIMDTLTSVIDPELGVDVVNLGLINSVDLKDNGICDLSMTLTMMGCPCRGFEPRGDPGVSNGAGGSPRQY